jgi:hypothetical protein
VGARLERSASPGDNGFDRRARRLFRGFAAASWRFGAIRMDLRERPLDGAAFACAATLNERRQAIAMDKTAPAIPPVRGDRSPPECRPVGAVPANRRRVSGCRPGAGMRFASMSSAGEAVTGSRTSPPIPRRRIRPQPPPRSDPARGGARRAFRAAPEALVGGGGAGGGYGRGGGWLWFFSLFFPFFFLFFFCLFLFFLFFFFLFILPPFFFLFSFFPSFP